MTLVAAVIRDNMIFMVSDILVSAETEFLRSRREISYPTKPRTQIAGERAVTDLAQKITEVASGLYVGCSGNAICAARFVSYLCTVLSHSSINKERLDQAYLDYFKLHRADIDSFSSLMLFQDETSVYLMPHGKIDTADVPGFGKVFVMGSGVDEFMKYLSESPFDKKMSGVAASLNLKIVGYLIEYVMSIMGVQNRTGIGIPEGWGGAFEMIIPQENGIYEKLDNIMFIYAGWDTDAAGIQLYRFGKRYFQYYEGRDLIILSQYRGEPASIDAVFPIDVGKRVGKTHPCSHVPQMLCITMVSKTTGRTHTWLGYNQNGHDFYGISGSEEIGYSIRFNSEALKGIMKRVYIDVNTLEKMP